MKANIFALLCIALLAVSVPQTFADESVTTDPVAPETPTAPTEEPISAPETSEPKVNEAPETPVTPVEEPKTASEATKQEAETPKEEVTPVTETEETKPVESKPETDNGAIIAPEEIQAPESEPVKAQEETKTENEPAKTEETEQTPVDSTPVAPTTEETPSETEDQGKAAPEATEQQPEAASTSNENQETAAPAEDDNQEAAAPVEEEGEQKDDAGLFALLGKVLIGVMIITFVIFVGCVYNYRYQMRKYKIAPFTPPSFMPECLFPRQNSSSPTSFYTELQVGDYKAAPRYAEV